MSLENLDMEALMQLNALMQNDSSENDAEYDDDEFLSDYDDFDDFDDAFDDYDDEFDDEFYEFDDDDDDDDDDDFAGELRFRRPRWLRRPRNRGPRGRPRRRPRPQIKPIRRPRPTIKKPLTNYASIKDLNKIVSSTNKRIGALKRVSSANARDNHKLRKKLKAAQQQQQMTAMMSMLSPPQIKSMNVDTAKANTIGTTNGANAKLSLENPKVEFETNPLALLPLLSSGGGNMNSMLPLLFLLK